MTQQELDALKALADAAQEWELAAFSPRAVSALIAEVERLREELEDYADAIAHEQRRRER